MTHNHNRAHAHENLAAHDEKVCLSFREEHQSINSFKELLLFSWLDFGPVVQKEAENDQRGFVSMFWAAQKKFLPIILDASPLAPKRW